jgi:hypothetical protein
MSRHFRLSSTAITAATLAASAVAVPLTPAGAGAQGSCTSICSPQLLFRPGLIRSHVFGGPTVTDLATGKVHKLPSRTNLQLQLLVTAATLVPRTHVNLAVQWLPNARATTNPFTEYSSADEGSTIHANTPSVAMNVSVDALTPKETGGWGGVSGYVGDLFSTAARPGDNSDFTHKLDLGVAGSVNVFNWLPQSNWLHGAVSAYAILDYVATGLPKAGDVVPKGVRRFDTAARPAALLAGLSIRLAPLGSPKS